MERRFLSVTLASSPHQKRKRKALYLQDSILHGVRDRVFNIFGSCVLTIVDELEKAYIQSTTSPISTCAHLYQLAMTIDNIAHYYLSHLSRSSPTRSRCICTTPPPPQHAMLGMCGSLPFTRLDFALQPRFNYVEPLFSLCDM